MKKTDVIIIGAGPVGLFAVHQLGIKGLKAIIIDNLDKVGGQCIELYPDKPIYDIPAVPECTGEQLTERLLDQIKPFKTEMFLNERVDEVFQENDNWVIKTNNNNKFIAPNVIIVDTDFHQHWPPEKRFQQVPSKYDKSVLIESNVWIGMNTIVLKGVTIGKNSIIGAGSVVTKNISRNSIAFGNPAEIKSKNYRKE
mgnify:CR=1 FL=1